MMDKSKTPTQDSNLQTRVRQGMQEILREDESLKTNIVSIYGIGGIAKGNPEIHDIDLNIFLKDIGYPAITVLKGFSEHLSRDLLLPVDINVIDFSFFDRNIAGTDIFLHKNRHSLFLYELKVVRNLLYGPDILDTVDISRADLIAECVKLTSTLAHRFNKEFLVNGEEAILLQAKKYARYAAEFSLVFKGVENPYIGMDADTYLRHFPEVGVFKCIPSLWDGLPANPLLLSDYYDLIVTLSHLMLHRYILLVKNEVPKEGIRFSHDYAPFDAWFVFRNPRELEDLILAYDTLPDYRKVR